MGTLDESEPSNSNLHYISPMEVEHDPKYDCDDDGKPRRTGNVWSCSAHIITAVIGSGVLSIPWSLGQMGWIAGSVILLLFALCTWYTSRLLADCYRHPDPLTGNRNYIYIDAVKKNLFARSYMICGITQYSNLEGASIGYTFTTATAAQAIQKTNCLFRIGNAPCLASTAPYIAIHGVIQIFLSQIPDFGELWWLSYVASAMSITYSFIAAALGIGKTATKTSTDFGSISGVPIGDPALGAFETEPQKVWNIFIALGNMAFAYAFSVILIEIQVRIELLIEIYSLSVELNPRRIIRLAGYVARWVGESMSEVMDTKENVFDSTERLPLNAGQLVARRPCAGQLDGWPHLNLKKYFLKFKQPLHIFPKPSSSNFDP